MYTQESFLYKACALSQAQLRAGATDEYTWTPKKRWTCVAALVIPTTALVTTTQFVVTIWHTPSGGSAAQKIDITSVNGTGIGTEILGVATSTGSNYFDIAVGDTVIVSVETAMGGSDTGVVDVMLVLKELP